MAHNYTGLVKAVNTTNRRREATSLSDDELIDMMAEVAASMPASFEEIVATRPARPTMLSIGELRNPGGLSGDDPDVRYINGRVIRVGTPGRSNRGLR
ncbi:MAG: hypothetical protein ACM3KF_01950 [Acidobacteriota bacterium]